MSDHDHDHDHDQPDHVARSGPEERDYLLRRADDHRRLAAKSDPSGSRAIHLRLQELYERQAGLMEVVFPD